MPASMMGDEAEGVPNEAPAKPKTKTKRRGKKKPKKGGKRKVAPEKDDEELAVGDEIEANYTYNDNKTRAWLKATITYVYEPDEEGEGRKYCVEYDDGEVEDDLLEDEVRRVGDVQPDDDDEEDMSSSDEEEDEEELEIRPRIPTRGETHVLCSLPVCYRP